MLPWSRLLYSRYSSSVCCYTGADGVSVRGVNADNKSSMWSIWNSEALQYMRREMSENGYTKLCSTKADFHCPEAVTKLQPTRLLSKQQLKNYQNIRRNYHEKRLIVDCYPALIQVVLDYKCNLNCSHCFQFAGRNSSIDYGLNVTQMPDFEEFLQHADTLDIIGGEATLLKSYDYTMDLVQKIPNLNMSLTTNGHFLEKKVVPHVERFQNLIVSVDGVSHDTYAAMRPSPSGKYDFANLCAELDKLKLAKRGKKIFTNMTFVVCEKNYRELPEFVNFAEKYEFNQINIIELLDMNYHWLTTKQQVQLMLYKNELDLLRDLALRTIELGNERGVKVYMSLPSIGIWQSTS